MSINVMNLVLAKTIAEREGVSSDRALQLGLVGSMMPGYLGVVVAMTVARREAPETPAPAAPAPEPPPPAPPPPAPPPPSETVDGLLTKARSDFAQLTRDTDDAYALAQDKQTQAANTTAADDMGSLVSHLQTLQGTLGPLDPGRLVVGEDFLRALKQLLRNQATYAAQLASLRKQVDAVVIPSPGSVNSITRR
jgi:hypothetical protein